MANIEIMEFIILFLCPQVEYEVILIGLSNVRYLRSGFICATPPPGMPEEQGRGLNADLLSPSLLVGHTSSGS